MIWFATSLWCILNIIETNENNSSDISCFYLFNIFILKLYYIWDIKCQILKVVIDFRMNDKSSCDLACDFSMVNKSLSWTRGFMSQ